MSLLKSYKKKGKSTRFKIRRKSAERELDNIIKLAELLCHSRVETGGVQPVFNLVKMISEKILYSYFFNYDKDMLAYVKSDIWELYGAIKQVFGLQKNTTIENANNCKVKIVLGEDAILTFPWNISRLEDALMDIGTDNNRWVEQRSNHEATLYTPIGVTVINNGNHSVASGIFKSVGELTVYQGERMQIVDLSEYYDEIVFNGLEFVHSETNEVIYTPKVVELGYLFEVGRIIKQHQINYIDYKIKKEKKYE